MALHKSVNIADGIHIFVAFEYANAAARTSASGLTSVDVGKACRQIDTGDFYALSNHSPVTWKILGGAELTSSLPSTILPDASAAVGVVDFAAKSDHVHAITTATPVSVSTLNAEGSASSFARSDHVHDHGNLAGGTLHSVATTSTAGFMSAADKTILDGLGGAAIFGTGLAIEEQLASSSTTSSTFQNKINVVVNLPTAGTYILKWSAEFRQNSTNQVSEAQTLLDGGIVGFSSVRPSANNVWNNLSGLVTDILTSGSHTIQIQYRSVSAGNTTEIRRANVVIFRIA